MNKQYIIGIIFLASMIFYSCSKDLDIAPPNKITDEQIKELLASGDEEKILLIMESMANTMPTLLNGSGLSGAPSSDERYNSIQGMNYMRSLEGNDIVFGDKNLSIFGADEYYLRDFTSTAVDKNRYYWHSSWSVITTANKMLNFLDDETVGENASLKKFKAWGLVARAYGYNYLMDNYQDAYLQGGDSKLGIMLYDFYSPTQDYKPRSSATETYNFIKTDLTTAISLLDEAKVGYSVDTLNDIDMSVAKFLLARIALSTGDWPTVISNCDDILENYPDLMGEDVYGGTKNDGTDTDPEIRPEKNGFLFNDVNPEVILGWPVGEALIGHNAWTNPFGEGNGSAGYARIDNRLYEKIDESDYRINCFMKTAFGDYTYPTSGAIGYIPAYTNLKFAATHGIGTDDKKNVGTVTCYYMRSSEVLLMKAEAQAQAGSDGAAKETLNILLAARTKAGETTLTCDNYSSMSGLTALQMVQLQSRIELWGEDGREFFNNKRWGIAVDRSSSANHVDKGKLSVSDMTLQIPEEEMLYNPLCEQN
uniref:RagB/SusD family nutrient uptake outer membrane protein n=1 Tax=uncultured Draconibacterium sp. TaxID=1573823 RepID=UPI003216943B